MNFVTNNENTVRITVGLDSERDVAVEANGEVILWIKKMVKTYINNKIVDETEYRDGMFIPGPGYEIYIGNSFYRVDRVAVGLEDHHIHIYTHQVSHE